MIAVVERTRERTRNACSAVLVSLQPYIFHTAAEINDVIGPNLY